MSGQDPGSAAALPAGVERSAATAWVAWVLLGAVMIIMLGAVHLGTGLLALARPEALAGGRADLLLPVSLTTVAWLHIVLGVIAMIVGVGLLRGQGWARVAAILLALTAALVNFAFLAVHPVWAVTAITMAAIVIYATAAHGAELAGAYGAT